MKNDVRVDKSYVFDGPEGRQTLAEVQYNYREIESQHEELHGTSAFYKDAQGAVFHTYSAYARGLELMVGTYNWLDIAPKGRDEDGLSWSMAWVRHHDRYPPAKEN